MTDANLRQRADERFERTLAERGVRDPREFYRKRLRALREKSPPAFQRAREYFETRLIPALAADDSDPLQEWLEYGRFLAELSSPGRTIQIDPTGRERAYTPPVPLDHLVLHLPLATRESALVVGLPPALSPAQRATYELLVARGQG